MNNDTLREEENKELKDYIDRSLSVGKSIEEVAEILLDMGYNKEDIEAVANIYTENNKKNTQEDINNNNLIVSPKDLIFALIAVFPVVLFYSNRIWVSWIEIVLPGFSRCYGGGGIGSFCVSSLGVLFLVGTSFVGAVVGASSLSTVKKYIISGIVVVLSISMSALIPVYLFGLAVGFLLSKFLYNADFFVNKDIENISQSNTFEQKDAPNIQIIRFLAVTLVVFYSFLIIRTIMPISGAEAALIKCTQERKGYPEGLDCYKQVMDNWNYKLKECSKVDISKRGCLDAYALKHEDVSLCHSSYCRGEFQKKKKTGWN